MKLSLACVAAIAGWIGVSAQQAAPPRDPNAQTQMRQIPVGTASVSGTVTSAEGRPIKDARVSINGAATVPEGAMPTTAPGGGAMPPGVGTTMTLTAGGGTTLINGRPGGPSQGLSLSVSRTVVTDASGKFTFAKLPAGHFTLNVSKTNYLQASFGQKRPAGPGSTILVTDGQGFTANVTLMRGGVISGTIYGPDGEPASRAQVSAWRYTTTGGTRRLQQTSGSSADDRGIYRLTNLQPGDYIVSATANGMDAQIAARLSPESSLIEQAIATGTVRPPAAPGFPSTVQVAIPQQPAGPVSFDSSSGYLPTFFPGTVARASAQTIRITGGDEHGGTDITVQPVEAGTIAGTISSPVPQGVTLRPSLQSDDPTLDNVSFASLDPSGKFTFRAVPPGSYTVLVQTAAAPQPMTVVNGVARGGGPPVQLTAEQRLWGSAAVNVDGTSTVNVTIALRPGRTIAGIVNFEMTRPPDLSRMRMNVMLNPAPGSAPTMGPLPQATLEADGRFSIDGVTPGKYSLRLNGGGNLKSSVVGGVDSLDFPFDFPATADINDAVIIVTDKLNELSGTLTESAGKPGIDYTVIAASTDARFWTPNSRRIATARTGADGKYIFRSLPPGDYSVVVVSDLEQGSQYDPEFLRTLAASATRVHITEGGKTVQDLRVR